MSTPSNAVFGGRLRRRRLELGRGLREVARLVDVSPGWLSRLERGYEGGISTLRLVRLAEVLDVPRDRLMLSAGRVPPDVVRALQRRPELCDYIRRHSPEKTR